MSIPSQVINHVLITSPPRLRHVVQRLHQGAIAQRLFPHATDTPSETKNHVSGLNTWASPQK